MSFDERGGAPVVRPSEEGRTTASTAKAPGRFGLVSSREARAPSRSTARRTRTVLLGAIVPGALLALWWSVAELSSIPDYLLPSPTQVVGAGVELAQAGLLSTYVLISLQRVFIGFAIGASVGLALGAIVGLSRTGAHLLSPLLGAIRAVPSLAWVPLLTTYMGIFESPKITLIAIGAAFPVFTTVAGALRHVDPHLVEAGRAFGLSNLRLLSTVQLPAVVPSIVSGLRLALAQAWLFLVAAELIASSMGLGFLLTDSQYNGRTDRIFLAILLLAVIGKTTDALIGLAERWLLHRWG